MKKILFVLPHMICGGVEKALLALIHELPKNEYNISVRVVKSEGDFVPLVPDYISYGELPLSEKIRDELMLGGIRASLQHYVKTFRIFDLAKVTYNVLRRDPLATLTCNFDSILDLQDEYDIAICFHIHMPFIVRYVAEKVQADVKCAWIHNDFVMSGFDVKKIQASLDKYDHYFAVSEQLLGEFVSIFPEYKSKSSIAHNIVSESYIRSSITGEQVEEYSKDTVNLLTIGRLDKQKGYDLAIKACAELKARSHKFSWYVLGNGIEEQNIRKMIEEYDVEGYFHLLGIRINPYPYINGCDIYVQPSKHEGYGIAVAEARMLNKPIVCTDFTGARDQIVDGKTGIIVRFDSNDIADAIEALILNSDKRDEFCKNLSISDKRCDSELLSIVEYWKK